MLKAPVAMGYYLQALIGKSETLKTNVSSLQHARIVLLEQNRGMVPLTNELCEEIGLSQETDEFNKLCPEIEEWAQRISAAGLVAYIEAEYFGGDGSQSAVVWDGGARVFETIHDQNAINRVLKLLNVDRKKAHDEFEAGGLGKHRDTHDWT
jgi:hypothetical protein